jgi:multiple antibiotic resistance protein
MPVDLIEIAARSPRSLVRIPLRRAGTVPCGDGRACADASFGGNRRDKAQDSPMVRFNLGDAFIGFLAVIGPPKILLSFADLARTRTSREVTLLAVLSTAAAGLVGVFVGYTAPALLSLFHIGTAAIELAGAAIFFVYALGLVLGNHVAADVQDEGTSLMDGLRELVVPFIASPLAMTAVLIYAVEKTGWGWRTSVAGVYLAVVGIDLVCVVVLSSLLRRTHRTFVAVLARLLGLLLSAVSVEVFLDALTRLGVPARGH